MTKLKKKVVALFLILSLICWTTNSLADEKTEKDVKAFGTLEEVLPLLKVPAPKKKYSVYEIPNDWSIVNKFFLEKIHLKLAECKAERDIVTPVKDEIIENPVTTSWYQEPTIIVLGISITFSIGVVAGLFLGKQLLK